MHFLVACRCHAVWPLSHCSVACRLPCLSQCLLFRSMCCLPAARPWVLCMLPSRVPTACYICVCQLARCAVRSFVLGAACSPASLLCRFVPHVRCSSACPVILCASRLPAGGVVCACIFMHEVPSCLPRGLFPSPQWQSLHAHGHHGERYASAVCAILWHCRGWAVWLCCCCSAACHCGAVLPLLHCFSVIAMFCNCCAAVGPRWLRPQFLFVPASPLQCCIQVFFITASQFS